MLRHLRGGVAASPHHRLLEGSQLICERRLYLGALVNNPGREPFAMLRHACFKGCQSIDQCGAGALAMLGDLGGYFVAPMGDMFFNTGKTLRYGAGDMFTALGEKLGRRPALMRHRLLERG